MKDLPHVYANPINHDLNNDQKTFVSFDRGKKVIETKSVSIQDIDNLLNDRHRIYKARVRLYTKSGIKECTIVSHNRNEIITMDNEKISLSDINKIEIIK